MVLQVYPVNQQAAKEAAELAKKREEGKHISAGPTTF